MDYQDALREWGARRLEADDAARRAWNRANRLEPCPLEPYPVDRSTVRVHMEFVPEDIIGSSMDTAAECSVSITGYSNQEHWVEIDVEKFDFVEVLGEIVAAGGGRLDGLTSAPSSSERSGSTDPTSCSDPHCTECGPLTPGGGDRG